MDKPLAQTKARRPAAAKTVPARAARADGTSTRTLILEAARRRLVGQGYANLNVRDIAADAGVNHALIGYHFRGKQQLVLAVLDDANTRLLDRQAGMYAAPTTASQKWQQAREFYEEDLDSGFVKLLMELMAASFHDEVLRAEFTPRLLAWQKLIEGAVDEFLATSGLELPVSGRAISAWITWFWIGMEASMALGIPEKQGHQHEALEALALLLRKAEAPETPRNRKRT
jgi:AcrR family transcriptional regulator